MKSNGGQEGGKRMQCNENDDNAEEHIKDCCSLRRADVLEEGTPGTGRLQSDYRLWDIVQ